MNSPEGDELEVLDMLIDNYDNIHLPIGMPDPKGADDVPSGTTRL